jgi:subtilase family serine protease
VALAGSVSPTTDVITGGFASAKMQIEVAVAPRDEAGLNSFLSAVYDKNSAQYHHWLTTGQFDARYAPTAATQQAVAKYLGDSGLKVVPSGSPFLVRATGSSAQVSNTFHTSLNMFKDPKGTKYFSNSTPVYLPASIAGASLGVIGLTNTIRDSQHGPGIINANTTYADGATHCALAVKGTPCREVPDISADADEYTPYSEYCTGSSSTPNSVCAQFSASQPVPGWFGIGGTSLSSPLVSAVFADRVSWTHKRVGSANQLIYQLYRFNPSFYFHDVTAAGHFAKDNGLYPAVSGFDLGTGVGTPKMTQLIVGTVF